MKNKKEQYLEFNLSGKNLFQNIASNSQEDGLAQQDPPHLSTFEDNSLYGGPTHYDILQASYIFFCRSY